MALNLWKLGGQPTSYNPLSTGYVTNPTNFGIGDYVLRFKAKSVLGGTLRYQIQGSNPVFQDVVALSGEFKTFEKAFSLTTSRKIEFRDEMSKGDIIIQDIELVQKPLPKLTINGIDGFNSDKWTLHANARVIDNETLELNAISSWQYSTLTIPTIAGESYVCYITCFDSFSYCEAFNNVALGYAYGNGKSITFTFKANGNQVTLRMGSDRSGKFTFKRPMLNLGLVPAPYEPKRGERMVMPTPKKNLFNKDYNNFIVGVVSSGTGAITGTPIGVATENLIPVLPNKQYVYLLPDGYSHVTPYGYNALGAYTGNSNRPALTRNGSILTFTTPSDCYFVRLQVNKDPSTQADANYVNSILQLEEGTSATPYEPYAVQMNPKPKKYMPKKNLLLPFPFSSKDPLSDSRVLEYKDYYLKFYSSTAFFGRSIGVNVLPNTTYTWSMVHNGKVTVFFKDASGNNISSLPVTTEQFKTITTPANCFTVTLYLEISNVNTTVTFSEVMFVEGSIQVPFEPYQQVLPRSKTGLAFNGDYLQLPSMTMDAIEIDCLIDSNQGSGNHYLFDSRNTSLTNGYVYVNSSGSLLGANVSSISGNITGTRTKIKATFNAFTDILRLFVYRDGAKEFLKGIIYKVTCYLNGVIVAQYDFENPNNIVGDKVLCISNEYIYGKNLVPSTGWKQGTQGGSYPDEIWYPFLVPVKPNTTYQLKVASGYNVGCDEIAPTITDPYTLTTVKWNTYTSSRSLTTQAGTGYLRIFVRRKDNGNLSPNDMDQIQIQLEEGNVATAYEPYSKTLKVLDSRKNLIPSFEDSRWSIHANAKVLGKDTLHLDATAFYQMSTITFDVIPNVTYLATCTNSGEFSVRQGIDSNGTSLYYPGEFSYQTKNSGTFTVPSGVTKVTIRIANRTTTGPFDFIRPQLYELTGKEATIVGKPTPLLKAPKRNLYNKR